MDRREAYRMAVGSEAKTWVNEASHDRARRCVAFLLLYGVINREDADALSGRISACYHADEWPSTEPAALPAPPTTGGAR